MIATQNDYATVVAPKVEPYLSFCLSKSFGWALTTDKSVWHANVLTALSLHSTLFLASADGKRKKTIEMMVFFVWLPLLGNEIKTIEYCFN